MKRGSWFLVGALALSGCGACDGAGDVPTKPAQTAPVASKDATPAQGVVSRGSHDPAIAPLLSSLRYKPDPYATQPGCISEPKSQQREAFVLWVELSLMHTEQGAIALKQARYSVTTASVPVPEETPESAGIPRLELMDRDGRVTRSDFHGSYREPNSSQELRTEDATPRDPSWVPSWVANASMTPEIIAHRIVLDGRVLQEVKRPDEWPRLSSIDCDDTSADGLKLTWLATHPDAQVPFVLEVMRFENPNFVSLLPPTSAREVHGFTILPADRNATEDVVLLVALTDTFRFVTRGVLVPRHAL